MPTGQWIFGATYMVVVFSIILQGGSLQFVMARKQRATAPPVSVDCD